MVPQVPELLPADQLPIFQALDSWWAVEVEREHRERSKSKNPFKASNAGWALECPRRLVYAASTLISPEPVTARGLRTFHRGNEEHAYHRGCLLKAGVKLDAQEFPTWWQTNGLLIRGAYDAWGRDLVRPGTVSLVELKSASSYEFARWGKRTPSLHTRAQANLYYGMGTFGHADAELQTPMPDMLEAIFGTREFAGIVYYGVDKDTQALAGLHQPELDRELLRATLTGFLVVDRHYKANATLEAEAAQERDRRAKLAKCESGSMSYELIERQVGDELRSRLSLPPRGLKASVTKKRKAPTLPWQCGYCAFVDECWKHAAPHRPTQNVHDVVLGDPQPGDVAETGATEGTEQ